MFARPFEPAKGVEPFSSSLQVTCITANARPAFALLPSPLARRQDQEQLFVVAHERP